MTTDAITDALPLGTYLCVTLKRCSACKVSKPVSADKATSQFYNGDHRCKPCSNRRRLARYVPKVRKAPMTPEERRAREVARNLARRKTDPNTPRTKKPPRIKVIRAGEGRAR